MDANCENPLCKRKAATTVAVSMDKPSDQKRTLCTPCEKAYSWGVRHGQMLRRPKKVWVLCVSNKGLVFHTKAVASYAKAVKALAEYFKAKEGYAGPTELTSIVNWMAQHDERLGADIICAALDLD